MRIQTRALGSGVISGAILGVALAACSAPVPLSRQFQKEDLDPAVSPPVAAPPSSDELAHDTTPTDVAIPDMYRSDDPSSAEKGMGLASAAGGLPVTVFLNRAGGTYTAGADDASRHVSSVLSYYGRPSVSLPPAGYSGASWQELVDCVAAQYQGINVVVTDVKPAAGAYTELVVSNTWAGTALGITNGIGGIAPLGACRVVPQAVGFVFEAIYDTPGYGGVRGTCEAVAHEIGHTLSLSHERLATDLMSYAPASPAKKFQDSPSACGVSAQAPESCSCGGATQSSHQQLLAIVGAGTGAGGGGGTTGDTTPPTVRIVSPTSGTSVPGNANVTIVVDASDDQAATEVKLVWQYTGATLACDAAYAGVSCTHVGTRYTWTILVGSGTRSFYAYARDAAGNAAATTIVTVEATSATTPPVEEPPIVAVQLPGENQTVGRGADLIFQADVRGARAISDVRAVWTYPGGSLEYPMALTTTPGVYQARTTVTTTAAPGWRGVEIQAADDKGRRTLAARRYVYVQ
jgi:hypothetical protein